MNPPEWSRIEEVFLAAAVLSGQARTVFLNTACARNLELREEVESLLAAEAGGKGALTNAVQGLPRLWAKRIWRGTRWDRGCWGT